MALFGLKVNKQIWSLLCPLELTNIWSQVHPLFVCSFFTTITNIFGPCFCPCVLCMCMLMGIVCTRYPFFLARDTIGCLCFIYIANYIVEPCNFMFFYKNKKKKIKVVKRERKHGWTVLPLGLTNKFNDVSRHVPFS